MRQMLALAEQGDPAFGWAYSWPDCPTEWLESKETAALGHWDRLADFGTGWELLRRRN